MLRNFEEEPRRVSRRRGGLNERQPGNEVKPRSLPVVSQTHRGLTPFGAPLAPGRTRKVAETGDNEISGTDIPIFEEL